MTDSFRCCPECHTSWRRAVGFGKWEPGCSCGDMDTRQAWDIPEARNAHTDPYPPVRCTDQEESVSP